MQPNEFNQISHENNIHEAYSMNNQDNQNYNNQDWIKQFESKSN